MIYCNVVAGLEDLQIDDRVDIGPASTSGDDFENADREPLRPRESVVDREPLRESQMTVPETPSPDTMAGGKGGGRRRDFLAGRNADNPSPTKARGRLQRNATAANVLNDQVKNSYSTICGTAEKMFNRIRQGVTCHAAPSSLKSAFLQPLSSKLASQISIDLLACTDDEFMTMFTGTPEGMHPLILCRPFPVLPCFILFLQGRLGYSTMTAQPTLSRESIACILVHETHSNSCDGVTTSVVHSSNTD